ncbi:UPF0663 transmembrane protein C17orf28 like protein [Atta colombica]|uniref:UPF0663 transmembrane protein C17orf28 like protein n=1 Tax=Atta colombica TaxID=520822 RepID=A0A195AVN9_9HYME|nr:UPF0663 transmembrane protein C17orf28 like protein [Atta colombica]
MDCLLFGVIILSCLVMLIVLTRRYFSSRRKLLKLPETWWTPGTENSVNNDIRPYKVTFSEEMVKDLKYRLKHTRPLIPPLKDVAWNYGTNTDALRKLLDYWENEYNFDEREKYINQYSHFKTNIQGLDIHFIHAKPNNTEGKRVLPLLIVHGWPGSIMEFYKIIPLLTSPKPEHDFVFEVIAPSLPGFGFSSAATIPELSTIQMSVVLKNLMLRLGHDKYYVQGGDWGSSVIHTMSCLYPQHVLGLHSNLCLVLNKWTILKKALTLLKKSFLSWEKTKKKTGFSILGEFGYFYIQATKPDTVGVGLNDSPAGLAAYIIEKFSTGTNPSYKYRADGGFLEKYTYDELIDNLMIYWISNSITTAMRIYAEHCTKSNRSLEKILKSHALPMFTSLLNTVCAYDPVGYGVPYNHLLFTDSLEPLVDVALQILIVTLDHDTTGGIPMEEGAVGDNLFINYLSRIHRDEDFQFVLKGITRLLNNPLMQTYLPNSTKKVHFHQELLVFFWKMCDYNKKFLYYVLKSSDVLEVLVPILYHLNDSRADQSRVGLMHIGVFILLLLSGERNFGVRLNKPYTATVPMDIPVFTGTHADLLVTVFHKIITTGHQRLQPLFDCLLTILVNVSPYLKTLSMVASTKLLHLLEAFSTPWFLFSAPTNHHLVFFLLEIFNNIIQYQFDGNSNLVYTIIRKRQVFHALANLPSDCNTIAKSLSKRQRRHMPASTSNENVSEAAMEGSHPAQPAEPGTLKASLLETPGIENMTEKESAHPLSPSVSIDINKLITNRSERESKTEDIAEELMNATKNSVWVPSSDWVYQWKSKLPLQTIMRLLQVLVPQVEKICIDKGLTDESEILKFLQHGTLVGLLPVPHPILIRRYQANPGTTAWFRTYMWGVIYLRNVEPPIWYDTDVKLFEIQRV